MEWQQKEREQFEAVLRMSKERSDEEFAERKRTGKLTYFDEWCINRGYRE